MRALHRSRISLLAAAFLALIVLLILAAGSVVRVPDGHIGAVASGGGRWLGPGWHIRLPFAAATTLPGSGFVEVQPVEVTTRGTDTRRLSVRLRYRLSAAADPDLARLVARAGLASSLRLTLQEALGPVLGSPGTRAGRFGSVFDPIGSAIAAALARRGVTAGDLEWRRTDDAPGPPVAPLLDQRRQKLLVIGLDAADWQIIDPLLRAGRLPNLERLIREGTRAPLRSYDPMISPLIWTTMATGVGPDLHGIADFTVTDETSGKTAPISSRFRKVKALWNIFSDAGLTSGFVGWWASHPAEPVRGYQVTELLGFSLMRVAGAEGAGKGITYPESYYAEMLPRLIRPKDVTYEETSRLLHVSREEFQKAVDVPPPDRREIGQKPFVQEPTWLVRKILAATKDYETIALDLLGRDLDAVAVYFEGIDMMGHRFQHCMPPRMPLCPDADYEKGRDAVAAFYELQDEVIGRLLAKAAGRTILVVSDHGFRNGDDRPPDTLPYTTNLPVEWHREYGIFILSGPGARRGASLDRASVFDIAPTVLYLAGLPASQEMRGAVLTGAIDPGLLVRMPPRRIPSYEEMGAPLSAISAPQEASSPEAQEELLRNLQALGYVGPASAPAPTGRGGGAAGGGLPEDRSASGAAGGDASRAAGGGGPAAQGGSAAGGSETSRVFYHRNLATYFLKEGRGAEAEAELLRANEIQPLPKSYEMLSEIRASRGDVEGAVASLEEGLRKFPEMDEDVILWIVELRLGQGRADLASGAFADWRSRISRPAITAACEGRIAAASGDEETAIRDLLEALRLEPDLSQAVLAAAPLLAARGRLGELERPVRQALARERRIDEYQNLLGMICLQSGRSGEALEALGKALDLSPREPRFLQNLAAAALASGRPQLALDRYRRAVEDPRAPAIVWAGYGRLLGTLRRPAEAAAMFSKALAQGEHSEETYAGYAASLLESGQKDRSRAIIKEALQVYPGSSALAALQRRVG